MIGDHGPSGRVVVCGSSGSSTSATPMVLVNRDMAIAIDREELVLRSLFNLATEKEFVSISRI